MKIIKFRGKTTDGKILFGAVKNFANEIYMFDAEADVWREIKKVAQFVGYDANGKEIYEGDVCLNRYGFEETATLTADFKIFVGEDESQNYSKEAD